MADDSLLDFEDDDFVSADLNHDDGSDDDAPEQSTAEPPPDSDAAPPEGDSKQPVLSKFLKGKEREWEAVAHLPGPLTLLKLPVDILHLIVKEVSVWSSTFPFASPLEFIPVLVPVPAPARVPSASDPIPSSGLG